MTDFGKRQHPDWAIYLPSVNTTYVRTLSAPFSASRKSGPLPSTFSSSRELDFLGSHGRFHWPYFLYSAGVADINPETGPGRERFVHERPPNSWMITDSGGYQIITDNLHGIKWDNEASKREVRLKILRWMEKVADAGICLDVPLLSIGKSQFFDSFDECLRQTVENMEFFAEHQSRDDFDWINVVHGRTQEERDRWFAEVRKFKLNGWSIPSTVKGTLGHSFDLVLELLLQLYEEGELVPGRCNVLHFLGCGRRHCAATYTTLGRVIRRVTDNPDLKVTHDTAGPATDMCEKYNIYHGFELQDQAPITTINDAPIIHSQEWVGSEEYYPISGPIMRGVRLKDLCVGTDPDVTSWDVVSRTIGMAQNIHVMIDAMQAAQREVDLYRSQAKGLDIYGLPDGKRFDAVMDMDEIIHEVFDGPTPRKIIEQNREFLSKYVGSYGPDVRRVRPSFFTTLATGELKPKPIPEFELLSPLRWLGNKGEVLHILDKWLPDYMSEYREPFVGSGSVFLHVRKKLLDAGHDIPFWINDKNKGLVSFWTTVRDNPEGLIDGYQAIRDQVGNDFKKTKALAPALWDKMHEAPPLEAAIATLVVNIWSWGHRMQRGSVDQKHFADAYKEVEPRVRDASKLLQDVKITNGDYADLLFADADPKVVVFLDPPYDDSDGAYPDKVEHEKLTIDLMKCECSWMITHSRSEMFKARALALRRRMRSNVFMLEEYEANAKNEEVPRPELVITNYDPQSDFWAWLRHYAGFTPQGFSKDEEAQFNDAFAKAREADDGWEQAPTHADSIKHLEQALEQAKSGDFGDWEEEGRRVAKQKKRKI